jgi:hypothetical protein
VAVKRRLSEAFGNRTLRDALVGIFVSILLLGGATVYGFYKIERVVAARDHDLAVADAKRCVAAWDGREDARDMAEKGYRRNAETLVALSQSATPERIAAYKAQVELDVAEIRATLPDPSCSLTDAREQIADE